MVVVIECGVVVDLGDFPEPINGGGATRIANFWFVNQIMHIKGCLSVSGSLLIHDQFGLINLCEFFGGGG